jgi:hypothetical protein
VRIVDRDQRQSRRVRSRQGSGDGAVKRTRLKATRVWRAEFGNEAREFSAVPAWLRDSGTNGQRTQNPGKDRIGNAGIARARVNHECTLDRGRVVGNQARLADAWFTSDDGRAARTHGRG